MAKKNTCSSNIIATSCSSLLGPEFSSWGLLGKNRSQRGDTDQAARCPGTRVGNPNVIPCFLIGNKWILRPVPFVGIHPDASHIHAEDKNDWTIQNSFDSFGSKLWLSEFELLLPLGCMSHWGMQMICFWLLVHRTRVAWASQGRAFILPLVSWMQTLIPRNWSSALCYTMGTESL